MPQSMVVVAIIMMLVMIMVTMLPLDLTPFTVRTTHLKLVEQYSSSG